jgi:hypothetical protein
MIPTLKASRHAPASILTIYRTITDAPDVDTVPAAPSIHTCRLA